MYCIRLVYTIISYVTFLLYRRSVGVITYVLLSGLSPFLGDDKDETLDNVLAADFRLDEPEFDAVTPDAKLFISRLLVVDPIKRMSAEAALRHPWLLQVEVESDSNRYFS